MSEADQSTVLRPDQQVIDGTYMLGYPEVEDLIGKSGGVESFIEQLSQDLETVYADRNLESIDRVGFTLGFKTLEWMQCIAPDYRVGKWIGSAPGATPTVNGTMFLYKRGQPGTALSCDAGMLTAFRTATTSALVINKLRPDLETLSVIGAGNEGQGHAFIISLLTPGLRRILFRDIVPEHAEAAVEEFKPVADYLHKERGTELIVAEVADPDDQRVELESDAIVTATMATEEVLSNPNFKEGIVIASVGADMIGKQELGSAIYDQAKFVADDLRQSLREGELQHAAKHLGIRKIQREGATYHGSLLEGRIIGITNLLENPQAFIDRPEPITVYDSTGFSGQDLAVGRLMMRCLDGLSWPKVQFHPPRTNMSFSELFHAGRKETQPQAD